VVESAVIPLGSIDTHYRLLLELGRGGTARVFLAKSRRSGLRKLVVLKTLEPELSMNAEMRALFRREAEVCARLNHPNIVQVHEVVEEVSGPIIVMEYLEGVALSQVVARSECRFDKRIYLHAVTQLLSGLHYFHELRDYDRTTALNAIHRDVSPQNVILLYEGAVKVLDFGIAKLSTETQTTRTGIVKGKLHYMPAEQLLSDVAIDRRADIFSAGVMLWEALAGRRMWHGHTENTVMRSLITGKLPHLREVAPHYPDYFYEIVVRATALNPEERHSTALELQLEVEHILDDLGGPVHPRELSEFMREEFGEYRRQ
jgi:eukaryotic-like serine/threonine-protein kinase